MFTRLMEIFRGPSKLQKQFDQTLSVKIALHDRVYLRSDKNVLGTVYQTGVLAGTVRVPAISVRHDFGPDAVLVPSEQYSKVPKRGY